VWHVLIALIGMPGSGKSTIARALAADFGFLVYDSDVEVQRRCGNTVAAIFARDGEAVFRRVERAAIADIVACRGRLAVLATGGGAVLDAGTVDLLRQSCFVVHVSTAIEVLVQRTRARTDRPLLADVDGVALQARLLELQRSRAARYGLAHTTVDGCAPVQQTAAHIVGLWLCALRDKSG